MKKKILFVLIIISVLYAMATELLRLGDTELTRYIDKYADKAPTYWGEDAPNVKKRIKTDKKIVALTLDACGSKNDSLDEDLIAFLIKEKVPVTMFINSRWIDKYPDKFKMLASVDLFDIQNHGTRHVPASLTGNEIYNIKGTNNVIELFMEVKGNADKLQKLLGKRPVFFRSGTAFYDEFAVQMINEMGFDAIGFNILGDRGATYNTDEVYAAVTSAKAGDIIICHMNHPEKQTGAGLMRAIPALKEKGFKFVKLIDYKDKLE